MPSILSVRRTRNDAIPSRVAAIESSLGRKPVDPEAWPNKQSPFRGD